MHRVDRTRTRSRAGQALLGALGWGLILCAAPGLSLEAAAVDRAPEAWLQRMASALATLEYEGTLVYLHGHELSTLRIAQWVDGGQAHESLLALSGPISAIARSRKGVTCVMPDARAISVPRHSGHGAVPLHPGEIDVERLRPHYLIHALGRSRVAGRETQVIGIIPKDNLRYGYRFFIDELTGLPLKTDLMDSTATPIEQVMFTEIQVLEQDAGASAAAADEGASTPANLTGGSAAAAVIEPLPAEPLPIEPLPSQDSTPRLATLARQRRVGDLPQDQWQFAALPDGFRVMASDAPTGAPRGAVGEVAAARAGAGAADALEPASPVPAHAGRHWYLVSDGLSSVSVYIERSSESGLEGSTGVGALHAAGRVLDGYQITAIGEAPLPTVQAVADAVRLTPMATR